MEMTEGEICRQYKLAKSPNYQIKILADLNLCKVKEIIEILERNGIKTKYSNRCGRPKGDYKEDAEKAKFSTTYTAHKKAYLKQYYQTNKDVYNARQKAYRQNRMARLTEEEREELRKKTAQKEHEKYLRRKARKNEQSEQIQDYAG